MLHCKKNFSTFVVAKVRNAPFWGVSMKRESGENPGQSSLL